MESKNKLRAEKSKAPMIYTGVVLGLLFFLFMIYGTYNYMQYTARMHLDERVVCIGKVDIVQIQDTHFVSIFSQKISSISV